MATVENATAATDGSPPRPAGLSSPPDSHNAAKSEGSDSELSDLEEMEEDIGEITPDHYADNGRVPVFKPTMDQFKSFTVYMNKINHYGMRSGIVKVVPPQEWLDNLPRLDEQVKSVRVREPIRQEILGTTGTYRQTNLLHGRSYNLAQWKQLCDQTEHQPPARRGERRAAPDRPTRVTPRTRGEKSSTPSTPDSKKRGRSGRKSARESTDRLPTPDSPSIKAEDESHIKTEVEDEDVLDDEKPKLGGRQAKVVSTSARRKYNRKEAQARIEEESFRDFQYDMDISEFTQERCEELERIYWKTLTYAPPLYGADMPGTLFDERTTTWNLGKLPNLLDVMGTKIPGVNTAYLYLGMWKATFAWHLEDVDLYSINFLHFGAPKQWYSISQGDARRFEAAMKSIWPADAKACDQFLRHKTFLISPSQLLNNYNIQVNKIVHYPGEFIVTYPYGYHSGYNLGYNCAEAVNFALDSWIDYGRIAKRCDCSQAQDSVWIDVREIERKLRGEETEYEESEDEELDDLPTDLPTPPESSGDVGLKPARKRKRTSAQGDGKSDAKRIRVRIKAPPKEPCALCPNDIPSEPLLPTPDGRKVHRICALYIPETYIETSEDSSEMVMDVGLIKKARLDLKCLYCRSKKGACFQCSQKKCTRAYHATCAAAAGVFVEQGEIPVFGEDGTEYKDQAVEFSCRFHRSKRDKNVDWEALDAAKNIKEAAHNLAVGETCQLQYLKGEIFAGIVIENRKDEEMLLVDMLPRGDRLEVEYKYLILPDASDYRLPKPSANAIPLPPRTKQALLTSKRQANGIPQADDEFLPGMTWAEFEGYENMPRNEAQVKVDLAKADQIWYYLGQMSTEYRSHYTEHPANPYHNPKSNFLDSIPKPAPAPRFRQSFAASYPSGYVNQNALNAARAFTASLPPATPQQNTLKMGKPYVYKPRENPGSYSVDPQAFRSQQHFLQQATTPSHHDPSQQSRPQASAAAVNRSDNSIAPNKASAPSAKKKSSATTPSPLGRWPQNTTFAKYPYLQKQHNRSPADYRSPYMPGGGFMNGWQGNLRDHLLKTGQLPARSGPSYPPIRPPVSATPPNHGAHHAAPGTSGHTSASRPTVAQQSFPRQVTKPASSLSWDKLGSESPRPNPMFHQQYQIAPPQTPILPPGHSKPVAAASQPIRPQQSLSPIATTTMPPTTMKTQDSPMDYKVNLPDVPPDSTAVIEQLMANLRKATAPLRERPSV